MNAVIGKSAALALLLVSQCSGQVKGLPLGWVQAQAPTGPIKDGSDLLCANYSHHQWRVEMQPADQLQIVDSEKEKPAEVPFPSHFVRTKDMPGRATVLKAGDGWLIGFDAGEFGGGLWWSNADGSKTKPLTGENVHEMISRGNEVLVLTGLAHLGIDEGGVYSYTPSGEVSPLVSVVDLGSAPGAATLRKDGALLIATERRILQLSPDNRLQELYRNEDMAFYYPHSIVVDPQGVIFIGMRFYLLRLQPRSEGSYDAMWLVRSGCTKAKIKKFDCICVGDSGGN